MELIIKPTEACNFKCTFCSSTQIADSKKTVLPLSKIIQFLERFPTTNSIIVNGGDPLMVPPEYYFNILDYIRKNRLPTNLSLTSNLWGFYKSPERWAELFRQPEVGVATSFNYGTTRRVTADQVYTEDLFWKVSDLFLLHIGYRPEFISVITEENEDTAIDNVRLAQKMGVVCKLNYAMASGDQSKPYVLSSIYKIYVEVYRQGLVDWEFNTQQMIKRMKKNQTICPQNRECDTNIRCLQPDGDYYSCGAFGDDKDYAIDFEFEMAGGAVATPLKDDFEIHFLKNECLACPMFDICNGCRKTVKDLKRHDLVESHCKNMKLIAPEIIKIRGS